MKRYHGPYKHRNRWRIREVDEHDVCIAVRSFATKGEAESTLIEFRKTALATEGLQTVTEALLAGAIPMPDECSWVYFLRDLDGRVAYVGVSHQPWTRVLDHRSTKEFASAHVLPRPLTREEGLRLETLLVRILKPRLNAVTGNSSFAEIFPTTPLADHVAATSRDG